MKKLTPLATVLQYENAKVTERFKINNPLNAHIAERLFKDMLHYLWLCEKHSWDCIQTPHKPELAFIPVMHEEMRVMDNMWHEFILITRDYQDFCQHYFGHFLHHEPNMREELAYSDSELLQSLTLFLNYVYDVLGEEVLARWFQDHLVEAA